MQIKPKQKLYSSNILTSLFDCNISKFKSNTKKFCLQWELNSRPLVYKTSALPLSYRGWYRFTLNSKSIIFSQIRHCGVCLLLNSAKAKWSFLRNIPWLIICQAWSNVWAVIPFTFQTSHTSELMFLCIITLLSRSRLHTHYYTHTHNIDKTDRD